MEKKWNLNQLPMELNDSNFKNASFSEAES